MVSLHAPSACARKMVASGYTILPHRNACLLTRSQRKLVRTRRPSHDRHCRTSRIPAQSSEDRQPGPSEVLGREPEAKAQASKAPPRPLNEQLDDDEQRLDDQVSSFAVTAAASEEQAFIAALTDMQQQASAKGAGIPQPPPPRRATAPPQPSKSGQDLREAAMRRIAEARKYVGAKGAGLPAMQASPAQAAELQQQASSPDDTLSRSSAAEWGRSTTGTSAQVLTLPIL